MSRDHSEANWNRRTDRWTDREYHVLSQADALTKKLKQSESLLVLCFYCISTELLYHSVLPTFKLISAETFHLIHLLVSSVSNFTVCAIIFQNQNFTLEEIKTKLQL